MATGLELLREEMIKRGATKAQTESKAVAMVLDILANTGTTYSDVVSAEVELKNLKYRVVQEEAILRNIRRETNNLQMRKSSEYVTLREEQKKLKEERESVAQYMERFNAALENLETAEARDRLRTVQIFVNSVEVKTAYDNTAYINWLGALLAGDQTGGIEEIRKINPKSVTENKPRIAGRRI